MILRRLAAIVGAAVMGSGLATPTPASACGGTFCDGGAIPVAQTGETILFVMGEGTTAAHIQIAYDPATDADVFAWVVPMLAVPEFSVGSQALFDALGAATSPAYGFTRSFDDCNVDEGGNGDDGGSIKLDAGSPGGPEVVLTQTVGAFDITVLSGGTAAEVMQWLGDNGYDQDPAAEPILAEYLDEGFLFAAFKLTQGADTSEIHPVVLEFPTEEACVPLRLTRIAAIEDLEVRAYFLADARVVPQNFRHVLVNPLMLDWPNNAANYRDVITLAVDAPEADGKAFVTEFAGPSTIVSTDGVYSPAWDAAAFVDLDVMSVVDELDEQGLLVCFDDFDGPQCSVRLAVLRGILLQFLPPPEGVQPETFWGCLSCYADDVDAAAWDGDAFATALQQRVIGPAANAADALAAYPYLTRMYTTISPFEMTEDPLFWANPDLGDVDLTNQIATARTFCNGNELWTLPDGREVIVPSGEPWPTFDAAMPYEEEVAEMPPVGAPLTLVDRREVITSVLETWNCAHGWLAPVCESGGGTEADSTSATSDDSSGIGGAQTDGASGCGCTTTTGPATAWGLLALLFGLRRRRRPLAHAGGTIAPWSSRPSSSRLR